MEFLISFIGDPNLNDYCVLYNFEFEYPEDKTYEFTYYFNNPDTLLFYNDSIIEWPIYDHSGLLIFKRSEGIISFGGIRMRDRLYRVNL
jgi:hypothetical protein